MDHYFINDNSLKSELRSIEYKVFDSSFIFYSDNGVFSKNKVDYATDYLINTFLREKISNKKILDVGCGYGVIGITLSNITSSEVDMIDINKRAIHLTEMNIKRNNVNCKAFYSDEYSDVNKKYDIIISNPPIRVGKEKLLSILINAKNYLNKNGEFWFVINKNQGANSIKKLLEKEYFIEIMSKSKGFLIFKTKSC